MLVEWFQPNEICPQLWRNGNGRSNKDIQDNRKLVEEKAKKQSLHCCACCCEVAAFLQQQQRSCSHHPEVMCGFYRLYCGIAINGSSCFLSCAYSICRIVSVSLLHMNNHCPLPVGANMLSWVVGDNTLRCDFFEDDEVFKRGHISFVELKQQSTRTECERHVLSFCFQWERPVYT